VALSPVHEVANKENYDNNNENKYSLSCCISSQNDCIYIIFTCLAYCGRIATLDPSDQFKEGNLIILCSAFGYIYTVDIVWDTPTMPR
jgi:hypothetical protein